MRSNARLEKVTQNVRDVNLIFTGKIFISIVIAVIMSSSVGARMNAVMVVRLVMTKNQYFDYRQCYPYPSQLMGRDHPYSRCRQ